MESERKINPNCLNAGNPFHQCSDYCGRRLSQNHPKLSIGGGGKSTCLVNGDGIRVAGRNADPNCVNASNPFHQCGEYCAKKTAYSKKSGSGLFASISDRRDVAKSVLSGGSVGIAKRIVNPNCVNAGNPFHQCGDYCTNKATNAKKQIRTSKTFQNGELRKEEVRKKEEGRKVDPMCVDASNPSHKCTDYCSQRTPCATRRTNGHTSEIVPEPPEIVLQDG